MVKLFYVWILNQSFFLVFIAVFFYTILFLTWMLFLDAFQCRSGKGYRFPVDSHSLQLSLPMCVDNSAPLRFIYISERDPGIAKSNTVDGRRARQHIDGDRSRYMRTGNVRKTHRHSTDKIIMRQIHNAHTRHSQARHGFKKGTRDRTRDRRRTKIWTERSTTGKKTQINIYFATQ